MRMERLVVVSALLLSVVPLYAQDNQYWTNQFGNRSRLLGGAAIGGANDLSAVFYNPGALALVAEPELLLSATVFSYSLYNVRDALGPGSDLRSTRFSLTPSLFAGEIKSDSKNRFAYSFLTRRDEQVRINARNDLSALIPAPNRFASSSGELDSNLSEYWVGGTWSRKVGESVGIGISPFVVVRNDRLRSQLLLQELDNEGQGAIGINARSFTYQHWRFLMKASLATQWEKWDLGFTVTTPSLGLFGSGNTSFDESEVIQARSSEITTDFQDGVSADYVSPLSVGFGGARDWGNTSLYVSMEWFQAVDPRVIMAPSPFASQSTGETVNYDVIQQRDSVFNVAVGVEHKFSPDLATYLGFHTDFATVKADSVANDTLSHWDLYDLSAGATFKLVGSEMTLGGIFTFGGAPFDPTSLELRRAVDVNYYKFTIIVGFNFVFGK